MSETVSIRPESREKDIVDGVFAEFKKNVSNPGQWSATGPAFFGIHPALIIEHGNDSVVCVPRPFYEGADPEHVVKVYLAGKRGEKKLGQKALLSYCNLTVRANQFLSSGVQLPEGLPGIGVNPILGIRKWSEKKSLVAVSRLVPGFNFKMIFGEALSLSPEMTKVRQAVKTAGITEGFLKTKLEEINKLLDTTLGVEGISLVPVNIHAVFDGEVEPENLKLVITDLGGSILGIKFRGKSLSEKIKKYLML